MKKINVNFSILSQGLAISIVTGTIDLIDVPSVGDTVSFIFSNDGNIKPHFPGFDGLMCVQKRIFAPKALDSGVSVFLEDINVESESEAIALMQYFEKAFDFFPLRLDV